MFRPNRWRLCLTTRSGLGVAGLLDSHAPRFEFGDHFVVDVFLSFAPAPDDTTPLQNTVYYDIDYFEDVSSQQEFDASRQPIDVDFLTSHLKSEIAALKRDLENGGNLYFSGDPSVHIEAMFNAVEFIQSHSEAPLFLVVYYDD